MSEPFQKIKIGDQVYEFSHNAKNNSYAFIVDRQQFNFKRWTWGTKNRITNECVSLQTATNKFEVDTVAFNEKMLTETLIEINFNGKKIDPTLEAIRNFKATLGDQLLLIAQWVNSIESSQGKDSILEAPIAHSADGIYEINLNGDVFRLRMWTWGEKNKVTSQSVKFDGASAQLIMDLQTFNELLLLATLEGATVHGKPVKLDINFIRKLDATIGDRLLQAAQEINQMTEVEKKTLETP